MAKNWRYVIKNSDGQLIKGIIQNTDQSALQICREFELSDYEVLYLSCLASFPFMKFINPERRNFTYA